MVGALGCRRMKKTFSPKGQCSSLKGRRVSLEGQRVRPKTQCFRPKRQHVCPKGRQPCPEEYRFCMENRWSCPEECRFCLKNRRFCSKGRSFRSPFWLKAASGAYCAALKRCRNALVKRLSRTVACKNNSVYTCKSICTRISFLQGIGNLHNLLPGVIRCR